MKCPLCGSKTTYEGLTSLACAGRSCQNWDKTSNVLPEIGTIWHTTEDTAHFRITGCVYDHVLVVSVSHPSLELPIKWDADFWVRVL